jgi:flagella basal body P-ring formation protein FlgA
MASLKKMRWFLVFISLVCSSKVALCIETTQKVCASEISQAITAYLSQRLNWPEKDIVVEYKTQIADETVPQGKVTIALETVSNEDFIGFTPVQIKLLLDGADYKRFTVNLSIDLKTPAYIATQWIKRYDPLTSENTTLVETYRSKISRDAISTQSDFVGKVARVAIPRGRVLTYTMVDIPPMVKRNDIVYALCTRGNLTITAKAVTLADAKIGDTVKLKLLDSKKEIYGKVVDGKTVQVDMLH